MSTHTHVPHGTTLEVRDTCLCLHAQRSARALARRFDQALRPVSLKHGQFSLLIALNRPEPPPIGAVAELLAMDRTTLTANLKPLQRRGLIDIQPDPTDRRTRRLSLTAEGSTLLAEAVPIWRETHRKLEAALAPGEADQLRQSLNALA